MSNIEEKYPTIKKLFITYLHQDWTIDGENLPDLFENLKALQGMSADLIQEINSLLSENYSNEDLDYIFFNRWLAGYEPDEDEGETWHDVLRQIRSISESYSQK
ncbi:contact-dependent growth inhibition system immunity protein [Nocardiopsis xinjiangensis]|uniref:contact-dependent growth inhibition system immunity protein n=1 Tax=Nocardiopsis xinjiangensis TaxID=124285 RepID=UPI0012689006|nr:contact-dependent growth inhibition system immunity protein [Nocardiopsis xinjiangensis]